MTTLGVSRLTQTTRSPSDEDATLVAASQPSSLEGGVAARGHDHIGDEFG